MTLLTAHDLQLLVNTGVAKAITHAPIATAITDTTITRKPATITVTHATS